MLRARKDRLLRTKKIKLTTVAVCHFDCLGHRPCRMQVHIRDLNGARRFSTCVCLILSLGCGRNSCCAVADLRWMKQTLTRDGIIYYISLLTCNTYLLTDLRLYAYLLRLTLRTRTPMRTLTLTPMRTRF